MFPCLLQKNEVKLGYNKLYETIFVPIFVRYNRFIVITAKVYVTIWEYNIL
jgi:hypothetical protein